jgi:hypothetical protein
MRRGTWSGRVLIELWRQGVVVAQESLDELAADPHLDTAPRLIVGSVSQE